MRSTLTVPAARLGFAFAATLRPFCCGSYACRLVVELSVSLIRAASEAHSPDTSVFAEKLETQI